MRSPETSDANQLDPDADNARLRAENDELRYRVSYLESQVEALREALRLAQGQ